MGSAPASTRKPAAANAPPSDRRARRRRAAPRPRAAASSRPRRRAERGAHRQLRRASLHLAEHQRGDVGAGDEQDQPHRDERRDERGPHRAEQLVAQRRTIFAFFVLSAFVAILEALADASPSGARCAGRMLRTSTPGATRPTQRVAPVPPLRIERLRQPDAHRRIGIPEAARHHADDRARHAVEREARADDRRLAAELLPEPVADDRRPARRPARRRRRAKSAAEQRLRAEHVEQLAP